MFIIIQSRGAEDQWKRGKAGCQVDVRWTWEGGEEGGGNWQNNALDHSFEHVLYRSIGVQTLAWSKLLVLTGKKLAFKFSTTHIWISAPPPLSPPCIHSRDECSQAFPVFYQSSAPHVILWVQTEDKNGERLGTRYGDSGTVILVSFTSPKCVYLVAMVTIQRACGSSTPLWCLWTSESKCNRTRRMMHRLCLWSCDLVQGTAPEGKSNIKVERLTQLCLWIVKSKN